MSEETHPLEDANRDRMAECLPAPLVPPDSPILRLVAAPVPLDQISDLVGPHIYPMRDRMRLGNPEDPTMGGGVGLAAPQIGISLRFFLVLNEGRVSVCINPVIHQRLGVRQIDEEGCLSFPNRGKAVIPRWNKILLEWRKTDGEKRVQWFKGFDARVIQHELDHLDGLCIFPQ